MIEFLHKLEIKLMQKMSIEMREVIKYEEGLSAKWKDQWNFCRC